MGLGIDQSMAHVLGLLRLMPVDERGRFRELFREEFGWEGCYCYPATGPDFRQPSERCLERLVITDATPPDRGRCVLPAWHEGLHRHRAGATWGDGTVSVTMHNAPVDRDAEE